MVRNMSGKPYQGEKQTRTRALTGFDSLASKNHSYQTPDDGHARACGLTRKEIARVTQCASYRTCGAEYL
jgi:hypothetical protein